MNTNIFINSAPIIHTKTPLTLDSKLDQETTTQKTSNFVFIFFKTLRLLGIATFKIGYFFSSNIWRTGLILGGSALILISFIALNSLNKKNKVEEPIHLNLEKQQVISKPQKEPPKIQATLTASLNQENSNEFPQSEPIDKKPSCSELKKPNPLFSDFFLKRCTISAALIPNVSQITPKLKTPKLKTPSQNQENSNELPQSEPIDEKPFFNQVKKPNPLFSDFFLKRCTIPAALIPNVSQITPKLKIPKLKTPSQNQENSNELPQSEPIDEKPFFNQVKKLNPLSSNFVLKGYPILVSGLIPNLSQITLSQNQASLEKPNVNSSKEKEIIINQQNLNIGFIQNIYPEIYNELNEKIKPHKTLKTALAAKKITEEEFETYICKINHANFIIIKKIIEDKKTISEEDQNIILNQFIEHIRESKFDLYAFQCYFYRPSNLEKEYKEFIKSREFEEKIKSFWPPEKFRFFCTDL